MLVSYDPTWPDRFRAVADELRRLGDPTWVIEHIGSTSVPGLAAKPIIDVAVRLTDPADLPAHRARLEVAGRRLGTGVRTHPVMTFEVDGRRRRIAHFFDAAGWETVPQRLFRDWLLTHPVDATRYAAVKEAAAAEARAGRARYNDGKTAYVQEIIDLARAERGLPSVPVHDKAARKADESSRAREDLV